MKSGSSKKSFEEKYGDALSELNADINVTFRKKKREFYDFYARSLPMMERVRATYQNLLTLLTSGLQSGAPKIVSRIKDRAECIEKFERNYRTDAEKSKRDKYEIKNFITDLIGVRVICLYEDDVHKVRKIIEENFRIIEVTDKTKLLEQNFERFGYKGLHLDVNLNKLRDNLSEFEGFSQFDVEIQVRSIVQDAWSEIDHKLKYKKNIPDILKRKIVRIAALFELADQEFTHIRNDTEFLEELKSEDILTPDRRMDSFSFISVMKEFFGHYNFENEDGSDSAKKIDGFVGDVLSLDNEMTDSHFKKIMSDFAPRFEIFKNWKFENGGYRLNPFTSTRHILYWHDKKVFHDLLFEGQRKTFDEWLRGQEEN